MNRIVIDVHSHYLPAVDDGPRDLQTALLLLRLARKDGVRQVVLTPHVYAGRWDNPLSFLRPRFEAFKNLVIAKNIGVELFLGGEVHLQPESIRLLTHGEIPFIGGWEGMRVMLLEMPDGHIPENAIHGVRYLVRHGVLPMLAHPERNKDIMRRVQLLEPFVEEGCLVQLTAASIVGEFGPRAEATAHQIIKRGWATVIASDAHNLRHRPSRMKAARREIHAQYGEDVAEMLTKGAPARLLAERKLMGLDGILRLSGGSPYDIPPRRLPFGNGHAEAEWRITDGGWQLTDDRWDVTDTQWPLTEVGHAEPEPPKQLANDWWRVKDDW